MDTGDTVKVFGIEHPLAIVGKHDHTLARHRREDLCQEWGTSDTSEGLEKETKEKAVILQDSVALVRAKGEIYIDVFHVREDQVMQRSVSLRSLT